MDTIDKNHDLLAFRLADILRRLNQGERFTAPQLAADYNVNLRTIQRDLNERFAYLQLAREGAVYYLEPYYLGKLNERDIRHFATLAGVVGMFPSLENGFLRDLLDSRVSAVYDVKGITYEDVSRYEKVMAVLKAAILQSRRVSGIYDGKVRLLEPYRLVQHHGRWYLAAVAEGETTLKAFRLAKLDAVTMKEEAFLPEATLTEQAADEESVWFGDKIEVVLTVDRQAAGHFRDRQLTPGQQVIKELEDGGLIVSSRVAHVNQILPIVRYWMPHVRVVSPVSVREACLESVRRYLGQVE